MNKREQYYKTFSKVRKDIKAHGYRAAVNSKDVITLPEDVSMGISHATGAFFVPDPFSITASEHLFRIRCARLYRKVIPLTPRFKTYTNAGKRLP